MGRYALLIASGEYEDQTLSGLRAPNQDVDRLAAVLEAPDTGGFSSVTILRDAPDHQLRVAIEELLADRLRDDLVLVYFSCHGIVDAQHRLYFATTNTRHTRPAGTAVSRTFVNEQLEACVASAKVLILDCCFSGAFAEGFKSAPATALEGQVGRGYVVLAASDAYEYAYEADSLTDAAPHASIFTDVLLEGLSSGAADLDGDDRIGVDELFRYTRDGVRRRQPNQTPRFFANDADLNIYLARVSKLRPAVEAVPADSPARPSNYNRNQVVVARGFRAAADRIRLMLGPLGRRILVEDANGEHVEAADARAFTRLFRPGDPRDRLGASYAADVVDQVHREAGDGAATAIVLTQAMLDGAAAALRAGAHPMALARGVEAGVAQTIGELARRARQIETKEQIAALIANAAGEALTGEILAEAIDKVGKEGVITVEESSVFGDELELTEGLRFDHGYISAYFITDTDRAEAVFDEPYLLLVNGKISAVGDLLPVLEKVIEKGRPLVVIAEDVEGEALATLVVNKVKETFKSAAVKTPGGIPELQDLAVLTGGEVVSDATGLRDTELSSLGRARRVVIGKDHTTIVDAFGDSARILSTIDQLRLEITRARSDQDRERLQVRLAKLAGGIAVIKVGGGNEDELRERKQRFERMIRAARRALDEGVHAGAATSLVAAGPVGGDGAGERIVAAALGAPYAQIVANAGLTAEPGKQVDIYTGAPLDLFAEHIYDSQGMLRAALEAARTATVRFLSVA